MPTSLSTADQELLRSLPNPFDGSVFHRADSETFGRTPDVSSIHAGTQRLIFEMVGEAKKGGQKSLFVWGAAGSGKTHLIARVSHFFRSMPSEGVSAYVYTPEALRDYFWTYLRKCLVGDLLRKHGTGPTPLESLLRSKLPQFDGVARGRGALIDDFIRIFGRATPLPERLTNLLRSTVRFPANLARAVGMLYADNETHRMDAADWLRGDPLTEDQLKGIGLPVTGQTDLDRERESADVVKDLCKLSSPKTPLVLFYDQMEAFRDHPGDLRGFHKFGQVFTALKAEPGCHLLQVVFARTDTMQDIKGAADQASRARLFEMETSLAPLGWEAANQLIQKRLNVEPRIRQLHEERKAAGGGSMWPLDSSRIDKLHAELRHKCTPRELLNACKKEFDRVLDLARTGPELADHLRTLLQRRLKDRVTQTGQDRLLGLLAGVPMLADLLGIRVTEVSAATLRQDLPDSNLVLQTDRHQQWVFTACGYYPQLWQRLQRWHKNWDNHLTRKEHSHRLILVGDRDEERLPPGTQTRLGNLRRLNGVSYCRPSDEAVAAFQALQRLVKDAESGDLDFNDGKLEPTDLLDWARSALAEPLHPLGALRELADDLGFDLGPARAATPAAQAVS
jgi:hypothetical protein